ncbi:MAG: ABC transporter permease [Oscillospiraceae bacterium]|nr:ABC transporter permease [Oscillospiraceae bacterium]
MNKILRTELAREIRGSMPRFLSIMTMVALGVMFLVGLRSAAPDMRYTADKYFDEQGFFDLQLYSTVGFGPSDVEELAELEGVEACVGAQALDGTLTYGNMEKVIKLHSLTTGFNAPVLVKGRLPEAADECVLDEHLLDSIKLETGVMVKLSAAAEEALSFESYRVVGFVESPLYISLDRGTSTLGDGSVAGFVILPEDGFALDYSTVVYLRASDAAALDAYADDYQTAVRNLADRLEPVLETQAEERYVFLQEDGNRQLTEGKRELAKAKADAERQLTDAEQKLRDGRRELDEGWAALEQGKLDFETQSQAGREALDAAREELKNGRTELTEAELKLTLGQGALAMSRELYKTNLASAREAVAQAEVKNSEKQAAWILSRENAAAAHANVDAIQAGIRENMIAAMTGGEQNPEYTLEALTAALANAALEDALVDAAERSAADAAQELSDIKNDLEQTRRKGQEQISALEAEIAAGRAAIAAGRAKLEEGEAALAAGEAEYNSKIADGTKALEAAEDELHAGEEEYAQGLLALDSARTEAETALAEGREALNRAAKRLEELKTPETYVLDRNSNYGFVSYDQNAERMTNLAKVFPIIFYLVAALVCLTTMTRMVEEERTQIGSIKALGYGTWSIAAKFLLYGSLAALLGAIPGAAIGTVVFPWVIFTSYDILYELPWLTLLINWRLCLIAAAVGISVTVGATLWAMFATARQTPAVLLRPRAPKPGKRILLEKIKPLWRRMSFSMKVSARNLFRFKKRLFMTVIGVAGCTALLIAGLGLHTSIFNILDIQFFELYQYDVLLSVDTDSPGATERVEEFLENSAELQSWTGVYNRAVSFSGNGQSVEGFITVPSDPEALKDQILLRDMDSKETVEVPAEGGLIDLKLAELLDLNPGDALRTDVGHMISLPVAAVREHYVYHYAIVSAQTYYDLTGETASPNEYMIRLEQNDDESVSALCRALMRIDGVRSAQNKAAMARDFRKTMESVDAAVTIIILSAAALAFVVLYNLTNINVTERIRELATIKVLGFYDPEVAMYVYRENLVLTALGIALGQFFGKDLLAFLIRTVEMDIVMFGRDPKLENYLLSILLSFFFAAIVNVLMYYRIRKIDMVQALKSVE